jgi:hypothetical protein
MSRADGSDHALGQFEKGYELAQAMYEGLTDHERRKTAHWATAAAWHMVCTAFTVAEHSG